MAPPQAPHSILVVQLRRLGDVILTTPALAALKKAKELLGDDPRPWLAEGRAHLAASRPLKALDAFEGNRRKAADHLGIGLRTLYEKLKRYGFG